MKRKFTSALLAACLLLSLTAAPAGALSTETNAMQTVKALGIMVGDQYGNMNLDQNVTRAQMAKLLTAASSFKDTVTDTGAGYSMFRDVKSTHWASEYIHLALEQNWMVGYTDGTFRPDKDVTLEEACTTVLRLLGYDSSNLAGSFPTAQLNKAAALGLRDNVSAGQGQAMSRRDCMYLFYNMMTAATSDGRIYAETLGYTVSNGEVDYTSITYSNLSGPYVANETSTLPFTPLVIYRNGKESSSAALSRYDVYYYNEGLATVWIYTDRISGKISAIGPNGTSPTEVTVSGVTYKLGSAAATYQLSAMGGGDVGNMVTLLLGMDDAVVDVVSGTALSDTVYYGVVQSSSREMSSTSDNASVERAIDVFCTDGVSRTFSTISTNTYSVGQLVSVCFSDDGTVIRTLSSGHAISGEVGAKGTSMGSYSFADDIEILDTTTDGSAVDIEPARLAGVNIRASDVRYYLLNTAGKIQYLILNDVTGDAWTYGLLTSASESGDSGNSTNVSGSYRILIDGTEQSIQGSKSYGVTSGAVGLRYNEDGSLKSMRSMTSVKLTALGTKAAVATRTQYNLADDVQVYIRDTSTTEGSVCYKTTLRDINDTDYSLTGWYDSWTGAAGSQIRIIVATPK